MSEAIKKQVRVSWKDWVWTPLIQLAAGVFGILLYYVIVRTADDAKGYVPVGTLLALFMAALYSGMVIGFGIRMAFNMEVSMGSTRKQFFLSFYIVNFIGSLSALVVPILMQAAENRIYGAVYSGLKKYDLTPYIWKWGVPAAAVIVALSGLCGVLIMRFGKAAGWTIWGIWMFVCIGFPNLRDAAKEVPTSLFGKMGNGMVKLVMNVPKSLWMGLLAAGVILALGITYRILQNQEVS